MFKSYTQVHFVDEKAKMNASYCTSPWGAYQKYARKPTNIDERKTALLLIWNDLPQVFMYKAILSFRRDLDRVLLQLVDILNAQFKYREGS